MKYAEVLVAGNFSGTFTYAIPGAFENHVTRGSFVKINFRNKILIGIIDRLYPNLDSNTGFAVKEIISVEINASVSGDFLDYVKKAAAYTMAPLGKFVAAIHPELIEEKTSETLVCMNILSKETSSREAIAKIVKKNSNKITLKELQKTAGVSSSLLRTMLKDGDIALFCSTERKVQNGEQQLNFSANLSADQADVSSKIIASQKVCLLQGATGSGKTETYAHILYKHIKSSGQGLVLVPEIALTTQLIRRIALLLGAEVTVWHSSLGLKQRIKNYTAIVSGNAKIILGTRSAICIPFHNLKVVIVDEEHDKNYKQEDRFYYHARDMAVLRAQYQSIKTVLVSATPSLETLWNVNCGKYDKFELRERFAGASLPNIHMIDMRKETPRDDYFLSDKLAAAISKNLSRGLQSLLYINRRGFAPLVLCKQCGYKFESPNASSWMTKHRHRATGKALLVCHHSGYTMPMPESCPSCMARDSFKSCGLGSERIFDELALLFPDAGIMEYSSDTVRTAGQVEKALQHIVANDIDIIVGTQMIAKGYHFPHLTLVGIVDGDAGLDGNDFRASEHALQMLLQVSGRAGRENIQGDVYVQTFDTERKVFSYLKQQDYQKFIEWELKNREMLKLPPFGRSASIILESRHELKLQNFSNQMRNHLPPSSAINVLGPAPASIFKLNHMYRMRFFLYAARAVNRQKYIRNWIDNIKLPSDIKLSIDMDPISFF